MHKQHTMICFPNAKINLGLHVISRRMDGYHNLETLFYPIGLRDALEIIPSEAAKHRLFLSGMDLQGNTDDNLVMKALQLITKERPIPPVDIHLLKRIPSGAGLGGGSANAAFMLRSLNESFQLGFSPDDLVKMAATLGADCAFFIHNKPALATGIGDRLEPLAIDLSSYFFLLVKPRVAISTKEAYALVTPKEPELPLKEILQKPIHEWKEKLRNDFESPLFERYPEIYRIKQQFYEMGATYASMSGSGSSVYAFFNEEPEWQGLFPDHFTWSNKPL